MPYIQKKNAKVNPSQNGMKKKKIMKLLENLHRN